MPKHNKIEYTTLITDFNTKHQNKYSYKLVKVDNITSNIIDIICPIHGIFTQRINHHRQGVGCKKCASEALMLKRKLKAEKDFYTKSEKIHNGKYNYSQVKYLKGKLPVDIICPIHGMFPQTPANHKIGRGCPKCKPKSSRHTIETYRNRKTTLYYIKVNDTYKIGLTLDSVKRRYRNEKKIDYSIIKEWIFEDGAIAYNLEQQIIGLFKSNKYKGIPILEHGGNSELFDIDIYNHIIPIIMKYYSINKTLCQ